MPSTEVVVFSGSGLFRGGDVGRGGSVIGSSLRAYENYTGGVDGACGIFPYTGSGHSHYQICEQMGHTTIDCFNRMNMSYKGRVPTKR